MILEGIAQRTIREMREQGKVVDMSKKDTYELDHKLAMGLEKIKQESEQKQRASRAYANAVESGMVHFYKKESAYSKICNYLSNLRNIFK
jgi:hypothetical protein